MRLGKEGEVHRVLNPRLTDEEIEGVSRELGAILHGDVDGERHEGTEARRHEGEDRDEGTEGRRDEGAEERGGVDG